MAITVETGAGVAGANSYISVVDCDSYHALRGSADWVAATDADKESALVKAAQYLDSINWVGRKTLRTNAMAWPRESYGEANSFIVYPSGQEIRGGIIDRDGFEIEVDEIPIEVINAQCEAALRIIQGVDLLPDLERGGQVIREKIDVIETEYSPGATPLTVISAIDSLLVGLIKSTTSISILRA
jgi:hypothetical protein